MKWIAIKLIKLYQRLSLAKPNKCRLVPTCSNFGIIAITRFGFVKGNWLLIKRLVRCGRKNNNIGYDEVPQNIKGDFKWLI